MTDAIPTRAVDLTITLGTGSFGLSGQNTVKLSGFRTSANITLIGTPAMSRAQVRVWGVSQSIINDVTNIGFVFEFARRNLLTIMAGDDQSGMSLAFCGGIEAAWEDVTQPGYPALVITANTGFLAQMQTSFPPLSYSGPTDVAVIAQQIAKNLNMRYEDNGVHFTIDRPYLPGTPRMQLLAAAEAAGVYVLFENDTTVDANGNTIQGTISLIPIFGSRNTPVPLIAPPPVGGMINYPTYVGPGLIGVKMLYNPQIRLMGNIQIQSSIPKASGLWTVFKASHQLDADLPGGVWETEVTAISTLVNQ